MKVLDARNVHQALPKGLWLLNQYGITRPSRNGLVVVAPWPVTTIYRHPCERVVFWPQRDANPAFHLYEALWMLAGRRDLAPLVRYVSDFGKFSDDGETLWGAYGYRWRKWLSAQSSQDTGGLDQLAVIAKRLRVDPLDRRAVLQMWDGEEDLGRAGKDVPCNLVATFHRDAVGRLDMTVFCRSNDIIWGAYGANAVHFSFLQEYLALGIGCHVGMYYQVSANWHAYEQPLEKLGDLQQTALGRFYAEQDAIRDPYVDGLAQSVPITEPRFGEEPPDVTARIDEMIRDVLLHADTGFALPRLTNDDEPWLDMVYTVLRTHEIWRSIKHMPDRYDLALAELSRGDQHADWIVAMTAWITRRRDRWVMVNQRQAEVVS